MFRSSKPAADGRRITDGKAMNPFVPIVMTFSLALAGSAAAQANTAIATFAGGCFWCVEADFDKVDGVISTTSGYIGGKTENPTYKQVSAGGTGHAEAVEIVFDPDKVSYENLLEIFWRNIDPVAKGRQFCDEGDSYRSAIFVHDDEQRRLAEASRKKIETSGKFSEPIATEIASAGTFYKAEDYHQDYYLKNPAKYKFYRWGCGRDQRLEELWGKKSS
jgi:peptide-methionine (S)-S-oxide reductase